MDGRRIAAALAFLSLFNQLKAKNTWDFFTHDDGGMMYSFFWFDIQSEPDSNWHPVFQRALVQIRGFV